MAKPPSVESLMAVLPQTQCEECKHPGCLPYAQAMAKGEDSIDHCVPGGTDVLEKLAQLTGQSPSPWQEKVASQTKQPSRVFIDPDQCIGCTKCIQVCPTDAIIGAPKAMHIIIEQACTGCDLCLPTCPVDCMHPQPLSTEKEAHHDQHRALWQTLHEKRKERMSHEAEKAQNQHQSLKQQNNDQATQKALRQKMIQDALAREKKRREES